MKITKKLKYDAYNFYMDGGILRVELNTDGIAVSDTVIIPAVSWDCDLEIQGGAGQCTLIADGDPADCVALIKKVEEAIDKMIIKIEFTLDLVS